MATKLSTSQKYEICRAVMLAAAPVAVFCLAKIYADQSPHALKLWFGVLLADVAVAIPFTIAFYYYRSKSNNVEMDAVAMQTLSQLGAATRNKDQDSK